jgi:starch synthase (maltosyl-transferring)
MGPRVYNLFPTLAGPLTAWPEHFDRIAAMGFDWVYVNPIHATGGSGSLYAVSDYYALNPLLRGDDGRSDDELLRATVAAASERGLALMLDLVINHTANDSPLTTAHPAWYVRNADGSLAAPSATDPDDPDKITVWGDLAALDYAERPERAEIVAYVAGVVRHYLGLGFRGFRCDAAYQVPGDVWAAIVAAARAQSPGTVFAAETLGCTLEDVEQLGIAGFDFLFNSSKWWDFRASWLLEQYEAFRHIAPSIAFPESHDTPRLAAELAGRSDAEIEAEYRFRYLFAAFFSSGVMMPMGFEFGFARKLDVVTTRPSDWEAPRFDLSDFVRDVNAMKAALPVLNGEGAERLVRASASGAVALLRSEDGASGAALAIFNPSEDAPADVDTAPLLDALEGAPREVTPQASDDAPLAFDGRIALRPLEARVFARGERVAAGDTPPEPPQPETAPIVAIEDVRPRVDDGHFPIKRIVGDRVDVSADVFREGHATVEAALLYRAAGDDAWHEAPFALVANDRFAGSFCVEYLAAHEYAVEAWPVGDRSRATRSQTYRVDVERRAARFGAWYELFPRSQGDTPGAHGTLADAARRLPDIRALGFDIVYLPPIHPIGNAFRRGRNNTPDPAPGDPGSPWAIGSAAGGHTAVEPALGTLADFDAFVAAARANDLDVALDYALQASPDHPYVREHPEWFVKNPDGTFKYGENPPKVYRDILVFDWFGPHAPALWAELRDVALFWIERGVRALRVDNPHTKPFAFWEWLIADVRARYPGTIFLAEAFTRPRVMERLAKIGFSQSYTYFTWRNTKAELTAYATELALGETAEYFRPNFWPNTPDILPPYLQTGGRPAFVIRLVLAGTLAASYGIYSGYELCENAGLPGREEYADSEKYEIKVRDWNAPGNIRAEVAALNRIRRENPAFAERANLRFYRADDDDVIFYGRMRGDEVLLVAVNLDPFAARDVLLWVPTGDLGIADDEPYEVEELLGGTRHVWRGSAQRWLLAPQTNPAAIFRLRAPARSAAS